MDDRQRAREWLRKWVVSKPNYEAWATEQWEQALAAEFAAIRREALEEFAALANDLDEQAVADDAEPSWKHARQCSIPDHFNCGAAFANREAAKAIRALAMPTKPGDEQ